MQPFTTQPLVLTPLSPIHIGSGVELDWTQAVLDGERLVLFDPLRAELPAAALAQAAEDSQPGNAMVRLQKLFKTRQRDLVQASAGEIRLAKPVAERFNKAFGHNVQAAQGARGIINALSVSRHALDGWSGAPYVPGTSLKGALRTSEVARLHAARHPGPHDNPNESRAAPSDDLLGRFAASSFAQIMVADLAPRAPAPGVAAEVQCTRRRRKQAVPNDLVKVTVELLAPFVAGSHVGEIRASEVRGRAGRRLAVPDLMRTAHQFHAKLFDAFATILAAEDHGLKQGWISEMRKLLGSPEPSGAFGAGRAALVRLGKFCSAESKTVAWRSIRNSKAKQGGPQWMLNGTTLWLADLGAQGRLPLGWAIIELGTEPSAAVRAFCDAMGAPARANAPQGQATFRPKPGMRVRVEGQPGMIVFEEDGIFTVELDDGTEVDVPPSRLRPA